MPFLLKFTDLKFNGFEEIDGEQCYIIEGKSCSSKEEILWISKDRLIIKKYSYSMDPIETNENNIDSILDCQNNTGMYNSIKIKLNEEQKTKEKEILKIAFGMAKKANYSGRQTEIHTVINNPALNENDFEFKLPKGAVLKEKYLYGDMFKY